MSRAAVAAAVLPLLAGLAVGTAPAMAAVTATRVSVDGLGRDTNGPSGLASMSPGGRFVAFHSYASDIVRGDRNGFADVFVRDLETATTVRVSVDAAGGDADGPSSAPVLSADGRFVAFTSAATDLVAGDDNGRTDVFVRDLVAATTTRVSVDARGGDPNGDSDGATITPDGSVVAFQSKASDLVVGDGNGLVDVFARDLGTGATTRVSVDTTGGDPNGQSYEPSIDASGRYIAFSSIGSDLVPDDRRRNRDVFVRDLDTGTTTRATDDLAGGEANGDSQNPSISASGRHLAFASFASDLVPGDGNGVADVFVRDMSTGAVLRVGEPFVGEELDDNSLGPSISGDGWFVAFSSNASNVDPTDANGEADVFVTDLQTGTTIRASTGRRGEDSNGWSLAPSITSDGRFVAFDSVASNMVGGDANDTVDVFVRELP